MKEKSSVLTQLRSLGKFFISGSLSQENHQLAYICHQLKNASEIHSSWFFKNTVNLKLTDNGPTHKISQIFEYGNFLGLDILEEYVKN